MSDTFIGDAQTNIQLTPGFVKFTCDGEIQLTLSTIAQGSGIVVGTEEIATVPYVDDFALNDLAPQTANYSANSYRITNLGNPNIGTDAMNRQTGDSRYLLATTTLDTVPAPVSAVSLSSQKITNLATPTASTDGATKGYVDTGIANILSVSADYLAILDDINNSGAGSIAGLQAQIDGKLSLSGGTMTGAINMDNNAITNLANATNATDAVPKAQADTLYLPISTGLDQLQAPTGSISLNNQKITNLGVATLGTDALSISAGDARYYLGTATLDTIATPVASVSLNGNKMTNVATPTVSTDLANKGYVDGLVPPSDIIVNGTNANSKLTATSTQLTNGSTPLNMNSQKITALADATVGTDALNRQTGDARYYLSTTPLNSITAPSGDLSLNSQKITGLADATLATDALNRQTGDARYYLSTTALNAITAPTASVSLNSQKITNLATPTLSTDGATKGYVDSNFYSTSTTLNAITAPTGSVSLNSQKITNLATPTLSTDGATKGYVDSNFYTTSTALNAITAPTASVSLNSQKITNLATPTLATDASTKAYIDAQIANYKFYRFYLNIGDVPSSLESYASDSNVITSVSYTNVSASIGYYTCSFSNPDAWTNYSVLLTIRSLRSTASTLDNDMSAPIVALYTASSFAVYLEETGTVGQNIAIDGIIYRRP